LASCAPSILLDSMRAKWPRGRNRHCNLARALLDHCLARRHTGKGLHEVLAVLCVLSQKVWRFVEEIARRPPLARKRVPARSEAAWNRAQPSAILPPAGTADLAPAPRPPKAGRRPRSRDAGR